MRTPRALLCLADGLSRLPAYDKEAYPTLFLSAAETFQATFLDSLLNDPHFAKIYHKIQQLQDTMNDEGGRRMRTSNGIPVLPIRHRQRLALFHEPNRNRTACASRLAYNYNHNHISQVSSLSTKKVGPFKILRKVSNLAYKLPDTMKINYTMLSPLSIWNKRHRTHIPGACHRRHRCWSERKCM